jgi:hypothetical protein
MKGTTRARKSLHTSGAKAKQLLTKEIHLDRVLFGARMRELDQEFARQTKQLRAITKKFGSKIKKS